MRSIEGHCHLNPDGGAPPRSAFDKLAFCCWQFWTIDVAGGSNIGIPVLSYSATGCPAVMIKSSRRITASLRLRYPHT